MRESSAPLNNPGRTNPVVNSAMETVGAVGRVTLILGVTNSVANVASADNVGQQLILEGAGWSGAMIGAELGAETGTLIGSVAGPGGAVVGGFAGALGGGIAGAIGGEQLARTLLGGPDQTPRQSSPFPVADATYVKPKPDLVPSIPTGSLIPND